MRPRHVPDVGNRRASWAVAVVLLVAPTIVMATAAEALSPALVTQASGPVGPHSPFHDTATLSGGDNPSGTIAFTLFGPNDPTCTGTPAFTTTVSVIGNGSYESAPFTAAAPGTYVWVAAYSGDAANPPAGPTVCGDPAESVVLVPNPPVLLSTTASFGLLGAPTSDTALLLSGVAPTGTITFELFGPGNPPVCTGPALFTSTVAVSGDGTYASAPFIPTEAGAYQWRATYSGDANNFPVQMPCDVPREAVYILPVVFEFNSRASGSVPVGGTLTDTAFLDGGNAPTGTIAFDLFGPDDVTCTGPAVFTSTVPVAGNGAYTSPPFVPTAPGTYRWVVSYSGDANNPGAQRSCGEPDETVVVAPLVPIVLTTDALRPPPGNPLFDLATLSGGFNLTGTIAFDLFGPDDATCTRPPIFASTKVVSGAGQYLSDSFFDSPPGTFRWVATYSGDANNSPVATICGDPAETVVVAEPPTEGFLTICRVNANGTGGDGTFTVEGQTFTVAAGMCSPPIHLTAGEVTVTQAPTVGYRLARCPTTPAERLVDCQRSAGSAVVRVAPGGTDRQTILTFVNRRASGVLKICKVAGSGVAAGSRHVFGVNGRRVVVKAGAGPGGGCALAGTFPVGTHVEVVERVDDTERVSAIVVRPARLLVGVPDPGAAKVTVGIARGVTEVRFTDTAR